MTIDTTRDALLDAALLHVPFDGWSETSFRMAVEESGIAPDLARALCPRGAVDLARAWHERGDQIMLEKLTTEDLSGLRFRDKIAAAVRWRLQATNDKDVVRRGVALFALPHLAGDGARMLWNTCDHIWTALGDSSQDFNWYTKRATLSGVYSSTVLFWLGDSSEGDANTWDFLDRRIDNVMQIEQAKATIRNNKLASALLAGPMAVLGLVRAPDRTEPPQTPGRWR